jgi:hypothetical protein
MTALEILRTFSRPSCAHEIETDVFCASKCPNVRGKIKSLKDLGLIEPEGEMVRGQMGRPAQPFVVSKLGNVVLESHD